MQIQRIDINTLQWVEDLFDKYRVFYNQPSDITLAKQFLQERLLHNESVIFVMIDRQGETIIPAGFTQLYPLYSSVSAKKDWILNDLYVEPAYRKQGVGKKLMEAAMQFAKADGATFIQLETAPGNITARSLYEGIGFEKYNPYSHSVVYKIDV